MGLGNRWARCLTVAIGKETMMPDFVHAMSDLSPSRLPARDAHSLPPDVYRDPLIAQQEIERIFRGGWIGVGRADMVKAPGDYITLDIAEQSILLLRDAGGRLRAYANTCRHRGARLLDGEGQCKGIRCPFHSWFYALDGRLVQAPGMEKGAAGFDKSEHGLIPYRVEERLGFAFICLTADAPDLDTMLGDFPTVHAPWPMHRLVTIRRRVLEVACNWKLFLDAFNEYYHLPFVHPDSIDNVYSLPNAPDAALDEDIPALVNQQRGMQSPDARTGRFHAGLEPNVAAFARWYAGLWE